MRVTEKIQLIERISSALQGRYTFDDLDLFLDAFDVEQLHACHSGYNSKRIYAKERLRSVKPAALLKMAEELELEAALEIRLPPKNWEDTSTAKVFITHLAAHKDYAMRLRDALRPFNISGFVAHEDIKPPREWEDEILRGLNAMDFFISLHTKGVSASTWCQHGTPVSCAENVGDFPGVLDQTSSIVPHIVRKRTGGVAFFATVHRIER